MSRGDYRAHKPRQIACVGFVRRGRVRLRFFCLRGTGRKKSSRSPCCSKVLLCHYFTDGVTDSIFRKEFLQQCRVGNIDRPVLIRIGGMEIDAFQSFQLRQITLNFCNITDVYTAITVGVALLLLASLPCFRAKR